MIVQLILWTPPQPCIDCFNSNSAIPPKLTHIWKYYVSIASILITVLIYFNSLQIILFHIPKALVGNFFKKITSIKVFDLEICFNQYLQIAKFAMSPSIF